MAAAIALAAPASAQIYSLGTGKQGFFTYSAGAAIAKVASDGGVKLRVKPFGGSSAYVPGVSAGEQQFGLANELEAHYAVTGQVIYKDKPQPELRVVAVLTPLYSEFFVAKDSPFKSIADLKGKRIPTGYTSQRVLDVLSKGTLANGGLSYADVQEVPVPNVVGGADEFEQGKADVFMFALGSGKVAEVNAKVPVRVLPIDHSKEAMDRLRKFIPVAYATQVKPGNGHVGVDEPTWVYAYDYLVLTNDKVPDDVVYKLTKLMHDHK
ncbi:MAG: TAXI family TRAP transporter solute-binding subunit, partial [Steroidobacteraceae bacterium]